MISSYLKTLRMRTPNRFIPDDVYYPKFREKIERILKIADGYTLCNPEDQDQVFGYALIEHYKAADVVHFCYVKFPFRKMGMARSLLQSVIRPGQQGTLVTHTTDDNFERLAHKYLLIYDPFVLGE